MLEKIAEWLYSIICITCKITLEFADKVGRDGRGVQHIWEARENCKSFWQQSPKEGEPLEAVGSDVRIILQRVFRKQYGQFDTDFIQLRLRASSYYQKANLFPYFVNAGNCQVSKACPVWSQLSHCFLFNDIFGIPEC